MTTTQSTTQSQVDSDSSSSHDSAAISPTVNQQHNLLAPIYAFLWEPTPKAWVCEAAKPNNLPVLLVDHANCELKAAQTAIWLMRKYAVDDASALCLLEWVKPYEHFVYHKTGDGQFPDKQCTMEVSLGVNVEKLFATEIVDKMLRLVKEELTHFEQVLQQMRRRNIDYRELSAARYAKGLIKHVRTFEPAAQVDKLIIGAFIEARSCVRFAKLAPHLEPELEHFYLRLLKSEAPHFRDYLHLAEKIAEGNIAERVQFFAEKEAVLISEPDSQFRFHSGKPAE